MDDNDPIQFEDGRRPDAAIVLAMAIVTLAVFAYMAA